MNRRHRLGRDAEDEVARRLILAGYTLLEKNYSCKTGEVDLIVEKDSLVAFVEVRSESTGFHGEPANSVTRSKQRRIVSAAQRWLLENPKPDCDLRFDVAGVRVISGKMHVEVYEDAFSIQS